MQHHYDSATDSPNASQCSTGNNPTHQLPYDDSTKPSMASSFLRTHFFQGESEVSPPSILPSILRYVEAPLLLLVVWCTIWFLAGDDALPWHGQLFGLICLWVLAHCAGLSVKVHSAWTRIPPVVGMLLAGLLLRNLPHPLNVACNYHAEVASELRKVAYCIILCRAGLVLDAMAVRKMLGPALRLAFAPNVIEASVAAILIKVVLGLPWLLALAGGFLLSAISPAIVLPTILSLNEEGYGQDKGIASLVVVAAGLDDVLSITAFGIFSNMGIPKPGQHDNGNLTWNIVKAPLQIFGGMLGGCLVGLMFVPITKAVGNHRRTLFFICLSVVGVFGCDSLEMPGMGALFVLAFGADVLMRSVEQTQALKADLQWLWDIMQPFLFGTIGAEVDLAQLDSHTVFYGLLILFSALVCRCVTAAVVSGQSFTLKERAFFACAWVPKATVQAALAGRTLELATARHAGKEFQNYGTQLRNLAVLAILFTAPIGAFLINVSAPRLLSRLAPEELGKAASNC